MTQIENIIQKVFLLLVFIDLGLNLAQPAAQQQQQVNSQGEQAQNYEHNQEARQGQEPIVENVDNSQEQKLKEQETQYDETDTNPKQIPYFINIQYCNKSNLHNTYENLKRTIYMTYPHTKIEVKGEDYPVPQQNQMIGQIITYTQYGILGFLFAYKQIFAYLAIPVPQLLDKIAEKRMIVFMGVFMLAGQLQNYFLASQGFAVSIDGHIVYDSIGKQVNFEEIITNIKEYIK